MSKTYLATDTVILHTFNGQLYLDASNYTDGERAQVELTQIEAIKLRDALNVYIVEETINDVRKFIQPNYSKVDESAQIERANHANLVDRRVAVNEAQLPVKAFFGLPASVTLSAQNKTDRIAEHYSREAKRETVETVNARERETAQRIQASLLRLSGQADR